MTPEQADDISAQAKAGIKKFFENNSKRRICKADLWYGKRFTIKRKDVDAQIDEARKGIETTADKK
jgi:hypothetical protein